MYPRNFPVNRDRRRNDAIARVTEWSRLTIEQQLSALAERPGACAKQINRLKAKLAKDGVTVTPTAATGEVSTNETSKKKAPPKSDVKAMKSLKKRKASNNE